MLIQALSEYYDVLSAAGKTLPKGYSKVEVKYLICLTSDGKIGDIVNCQKKQEVMVGKKIKEIWIPCDFTMPQRTEKPGIDSNVIEHRPIYIFGLNYENDILSPEDSTNRAKKSHQAFIEKNTEFIKDLSSPIINAYRAFLGSWVPEKEVENKLLLDLKKDYGKSSYAFCLMGSPDVLLHEDEQIRSKWNQQISVSDPLKNSCIAQCGISGEIGPIAQIHDKIKGLSGGSTTGSVFVGYNNSSETSYGNEQAYNSNISVTIMKKYTEALNYLLNGRQHKMLFDDITVLFWAMNSDDACENAFNALLSGSSEGINAEETEQMLNSLLKRAKNGLVTEGQIESTDFIKENVDFYMVGLKPNISRIAVKFIYRKKFADILWNIAKFQLDMQVTEEIRPVPLYQIKKELISPKSSTEKINPDLMTKLFESIIYAKPYPMSLLEIMVRRIKTDRANADGSVIRISPVRAGVIKACLNRNYEKEEISVALDQDNHGQAYLCGRLFAVLEKLQENAASSELNRTIKVAYFSSASSTPAVVFPKLIKLSHHHLRKLNKESAIFFNKLMQEIIADLSGEFPDMLSLKQQGEFIIGYYQQYQNFYKKHTTSEDAE